MMVKPIGTLARVEVDTTSKQGAVKARHDRGGGKRSHAGRNFKEGCAGDGHVDVLHFNQRLRARCVRLAPGLHNNRGRLCTLSFFCVLAGEGLVFGRGKPSSPPTRARHKESGREGRERSLGFHRERSSCWRLRSEAWVFIGNVLRAGGLLSAGQRSVTARPLRESDLWEVCLRCG